MYGFAIHKHRVSIRIYARSLRRDGNTIYLHTPGSNQFFSVTA
jgi:hypothetical protein